MTAVQLLALLARLEGQTDVWTQVLTETITKENQS